MKKHVCAAISSSLLFGSALAGLAQGISTETSNVPDDPYAWALFSYDGEASINPKKWGGTGDPKGQMLEFDSAVSAPLLSTPDITLGLGAMFTWSGISFKDLPGVKDYDLYVVGVPVDAIYTGVPGWTFWGNVTPGLFTDFTKITGDDYRTLAHAMVLYEMMPELKLGLGASYDREFGEDRLYPLGGAIWSIGREWRLELLLPAPAINYAPTDRLVFFADARPAGNKWNLDAEEDGEADFKLECWRIGAGFEYRLFGSLWAHLAGGMTLNRKYEIHDGAKTVLESDVDDTYFVRAGLAIQ